MRCAGRALRAGVQSVAHGALIGPQAVVDHRRQHADEAPVGFVITAELLPEPRERPR
jgi:hypothetical protein